MFLVYLWNYIRGYVIIVVMGKSIERFINICSRRQILLWDIEKKDNESAVMKASLRGFKHMRPAAKKSACRVRIVKKCGFPFVLARLKKRRGFKAGFAIFIFLFVLSTSLIWDIEITGCKPDVLPQIMNVLNHGKIKRGRFKIGLDPRKIAQEIVMQVDGVAWAGVEIKGVKLTVTVEDSISVPKLIQNNQAYNIVAERDGLITQMEVYAGNALVKEGETVRKGQVLVSGRIQSQRPDLGDFGSKEVHAQGKIIARTWYESSLPVSMEYTQRIRTENEHKTVYLRFLDGKIKLPGKKLSFELYETETYDKNLTGPFGINLPIGLTIEKSFEIIENKIGLL
ncbi:MAG: sporulation protein YqfD [Clostridiaceae bacterium]|nr:sporulation protein YqfD [Clostridiaceae bacterium]